MDSITLLQITAEVFALPTVENAALVMATDLNLEVLRDADLLVANAAPTGPNDLVIAVRARDESSARAALEQAEALLTRRRKTAGQSDVVAVPKSLRSARRAEPDANLAVISVPGAYAAAEARAALSEGLNVFLFSDNVALEDEVDLKRRALARGLLVMGPDCGTAILNGVGLGFANVVRRGAIGIVGASGTGLQEVSSLIHQAGLGISAAIGSGSRDLHAQVGGITTLQAINLLREDPGTETIALIAKPSDATVARRVLSALAATGKPAVAYLQGSDVVMPQEVRAARSLVEVASLATGTPIPGDPEVHGRLRGDVRGLFCGGTLAKEAQAVLGSQHQMLDFGDDEYTRGRAHPMIDPTLRNEAIVRAGREARIGVILLDVILGLGAHADPAGAALPAISNAIAAARADGRELSVVAHVVGTEQDPQILSRQEASLRSAGVQVFGSNFAAARAAGRLVAGVLA